MSGREPTLTDLHTRLSVLEATTKLSNKTQLDSLDEIKQRLEKLSSQVSNLKVRVAVVSGTVALLVSVFMKVTLGH